MENARADSRPAVPKAATSRLATRTAIAALKPALPAASSLRTLRFSPTQSGFSTDRHATPLPNVPLRRGAGFVRERVGGAVAHGGDRVVAPKPDRDDEGCAEARYRRPLQAATTDSRKELRLRADDRNRRGIVLDERRRGATPTTTRRLHGLECHDVRGSVQRLLRRELRDAGPTPR